MDPLDLRTSWYGNAIPEPCLAQAEQPSWSKPWQSTNMQRHSGPCLSTGSIVASRYRIERPLGEGAFAAVYSAYDLSLRRRVAVKVHDLQVAGLISADEARLQATTQHPNVMPLYDAGSDTFAGVSFLVMPLYPGADLGAVLRRYGPMPFRSSIQCVDQICSAVSYLWQRRQVVHGDIKPSNIWLTQSGAALLMDFNLPGALARGSPRGGTPGFTAPEALDGFADHRSDVFSLGCVLYTCLAGIPPFPDDMAARSGGYTPLGQIRPETRPQLEEVVRTVLAVRPDDRFQSAREFQTALRYHRAGATGLCLWRQGAWDLPVHAVRSAGWLVGRIAWNSAWLVGRAWRLSARFLARFIRHTLKHPLEALIEAIMAWIAGEWAVAHAHLWLHLILTWYAAHQTISVAVPSALLLACIAVRTGNQMSSRNRRYLPPGGR